MSDEFQSKYCRGETCGKCGEAEAYHKVGEIIFDDDPNKKRHPFTQYLCNDCFFEVMGPAAREFNFATGGLPKPADQYDKEGDEIREVLEPLVEEFMETFDPGDRYDGYLDRNDYLDIEFWIMEWFNCKGWGFVWPRDISWGPFFGGPVAYWIRNWQEQELVFDNPRLGTIKIAREWKCNGGGGGWEYGVTRAEKKKGKK